MITTTARPATDLGYLLVKHSGRVQAFDQAFGTAHVFCPEAEEDRCTADELFAPTRSRVVDLHADEAGAVAWWEELTGSGGEGMVVKPLGTPPPDPDGKRRLVQPGLKCRGREYLRLVYGPDYTEPEHLERLRKRSPGRKRSLAMREYALGLEALDRLVAGEPLWRVHQPVFGVLALESEPVDPRL
jgi:protein phosphatase